MPIDSESARSRRGCLYQYPFPLAERAHAKGYFGNWNTIIGGGSVSGPADDVLIVAVVDQDRPAGQQANASLPLHLTAMRKGKLLASRTAKDVLIPEKGPAYTGFWLNDVACAGSVQVTAQIGSSRKLRRLT